MTKCYQNQKKKKLHTLPDTEEWLDPLMKLRHSRQPPALHHSDRPSCSTASSLQSVRVGNKYTKYAQTHRWVLMLDRKTISYNLTSDELNKYLNRLSDPCQVALGLLLPLSMSNLFGLLQWNIFLDNVLVIFSLLYSKVWASEKVMHNRN